MKHTKKIAIKHLAKKSGIDKKELQEMLYQHGLTKKADAKKVLKTPAKFLIRDQQGINEYGYSKLGFLDSFGVRKTGLVSFVLLGLFGLTGLGMENYAKYQSVMQKSNVVEVVSEYSSDNTERTEQATRKVEFTTSGAGDSDLSHSAPPLKLPNTGAIFND